MYPNFLKMNKSRLIIIILALICAIFWAAYKYFKPFKDPAFNTIILHKADNNKNVSLTSLQGKATIIAFFQTWCGDCIREMPTIIKLQNEINSPDLKIIMVTDETLERINTFKNRFPNFNFEYYVVDQPLSKMGISKYPTTYLLDAQGNIKLRTFEGYDWSETKSIDLVKLMLK